MRSPSSLLVAVVLFHDWGSCCVAAFECVDSAVEFAGYRPSRERLAMMSLDDNEALTKYDLGEFRAARFWAGGEEGEK